MTFIFNGTLLVRRNFLRIASLVSAASQTGSLAVPATAQWQTVTFVEF